MIKRLILTCLFLVTILSPCLIQAQATSANTNQTSQQTNQSLNDPLFGAVPTSESLTAEGAPPIALQITVIALLALLPWILIMFTSYIKIVVVISLLRNALGVQQTPPNQVINGIAIILTLFIMFPTGLSMYNDAEAVIKKNPPSKVISADTAPYILSVAEAAKVPFKKFLQKNADASHIAKFYRMAYRIFPEPFRKDLKPQDIIIIAPAFITTQLKDAFSIGVLIYLPFFVIDLVTSNILLAMGMMMLSPLSISLPLKLLLLVMLDGWTILIEGLVLTFR